MRSFILLSVLLLSSCTRVPGRAECEQLVAHLVDLELKEKTTGQAVSRDQVLKEMGGTRLEHCMKNLPLERVRCGLRATTLKQAEDCDR